jgi:hypothetical protein
MSLVPHKTRKPRKDALYGRDEMVILNRYKEDYRRLMTRELRGDLIRTQVLGDLFNHWTERGMAPITEEDSLARMKVKGSLIFEPFETAYQLSLGACRLDPE